MSAGAVMCHHLLLDIGGGGGGGIGGIPVCVGS